MKKLFSHPWLIIAFYAVITVFFALQLPKIELDNNNLHFVPESTPELIASNEISDTFGNSFFVIVGLEQKYGTIFEKDFLLKVKDYVAKVEELDSIGEINSIVSTDYITSEGDAIVADKIITEDFSGTDEEISALKTKLLSWDIYKRSLLSDDLSSTEILIPFEDEDAQEEQLYVRNLAHEMFDSDTTTVYVTGMPIVSATINESMAADMKLLIPIVIIVVLLIIFIPLKRISFVIISLVSVIVAVVWSVGAMPLFAVKLSIIATMIPVILVAIGSSYGLHLIIHYFTESPENFEAMTREEHTAYIIKTTRVLVTPITLAAVTTTVSFVSFCFTPVIPIFHFGIFSSIGVIISFVSSLTLVPAILIIRGPASLKKFKRQVTRQSALALNANEKMANVFTRVVRHCYIVLIVALAVIGCGIWGASKVVSDNVFLEYFREGTEIVKSDAFISKKFGGSKVINVIMEAPTSERALHPDNLGALDGLKNYLNEKVPETGSVLGFTDLVKRINQVFNADESPEGLTAAGGNREQGTGNGEQDEPDAFGFGFGFDAAPSPAPVRSASAAPKREKPDKTYTSQELAALFDEALSGGKNRNLNVNDFVWEIEKLINYDGASYYEVPLNPVKYGKESRDALSGLVSNYLVLLSGDIKSFANDPLEPTKLRTMVQLRTTGNIDTHEVIDLIRAYSKANFPADTTITIGGSALVEKALNDLVVSSLWTSMLISFTALFIIITITNRSFIAGLICVIPLGVIILVNFAFMGFTGIKLNIATALISSLSMGIGIDYTIHYLEAYKREYKASGGKGNFFRKAYFNAGLAIIVDALSVGVGFAVLLLSRFVLLAEFGLLVAVSMISSALMGLVLVPALLILIKPKFLERS